MTTDPALQDTLDRFRCHLVATGKSAHTIEAYGRDVRLFKECFSQTNGRSLAPEVFTPIDVRQYRSYLLMAKKHKPATVNRELASLSAFCEWAREAGLIPANPAQEISLVEEVRPAPKWLDKNQQHALLRTVQEKGRKRHIALITLMINTGLRVSEVPQLPGHKSVDTTRIYTTPSEQDLQREVEKIARIEPVEWLQRSRITHE